MRPIFIGGCDRSGTTMLGSLLGGHSHCLTVPEAQFVVEVWHASLRRNISGDLRAIFDAVCSHWRFKLWAIQPDKDLVPDSVWSGSYAGLIRWFVSEYGRHTGKALPAYWIDHTPSSTRYAVTLFEHFPEAKMIHIVRDGRAVAASVLPLDWGPNTIMKATRWWVEKVAHGLAAEASFGPDRVIRVRYEDLVIRSESELRRICDFLELDYDPGMAMGGKWTVPQYTIRQHTLVGRPPDTSRLNTWQRELTQRQVEMFESLSGDFLPQLGYELTYGGCVPKITAWEQLQQEVVEIVRRETSNRFHRTRRIQTSV